MSKEESEKLHRGTKEKANRGAAETGRFRRRWSWLTRTLSVCVMAGTIGALVLPAITMSQDPCSLTEHVHTAECYIRGEASELCCVLPEIIEHQHGDTCYEVGVEGPICGMQEIIPHTHDEACYEIVEVSATEEPTIVEPAIVEPAVEETTIAETTAEETTTEAAETQETTTEAAESEAPIAEEPTIEETTTEETTAEETTAEETTAEEATTEETTAEETTTEEATTEETTTEAAETQETTTEAAERILTCTLPEITCHQHTEECYMWEQILTCEIPEHTHTSECQGGVLSEAEQAEVTDVIYLIDMIPTAEEIETNLLTKAGEEQLAYKEKVIAQINGAFEGYDGLSDIQKLSVTNYVKLADYAYLITEDPAAKEIIGQIGSLPDMAGFEEKYASLSAIQKPVYVEELLKQIEEIHISCESLTSEQKALILNYSKLTELETYLSTLVKPEGTLEFAAEDYITTVTAPTEAKLPEDTVITARPLFDSHDSAVSTFAFFASPEEEEGSAYVDKILNAVTWGEVTRVKLFDITLTSGEEEVQPEAAVEIKTEFTEPLSLNPGEVVYGVHIGEDGEVDILPANTERDENGNIAAITHNQNSFSPSGYILVHISNPTDIGPNILPVHYCIWVNDQWIIAGSTRTGWYGNYTNLIEWTKDTRDYITLEQMSSVLEPYGLDVDNTEELQATVWYQRAEAANTKIYHDTIPAMKTIIAADGTTVEKEVFFLSGNAVKDDGYHIYYVPYGTESNAATYPKNSELGADLKQESKFYTFTVRDMNNVVYSLEEENDPTIFPQQQILRYGQPISVTVRANLDNDGTPVGWMWVNDVGKVVHGIERIYDANGDGVFAENEVDNRFGYSYDSDKQEATYTFGSAEKGTGILGCTTLIPFSRAVDGAAQDTKKQVDIVVHIDNQWQKVGQLNLMYQKEGVCLDSNGDPLWFVTAGQVYTILKDFGFHPETYFPDDDTNTGHVFTYAIGAFTPEAGKMTMRADGINTRLENADGTATVAIGLGNEESADNYTLFYLPNSSGESFEDVHKVDPQVYGANETLIKGDRFYSIKVVDDYQLVYYGYETDNFKAYVPEGNSVSVKVQNSLSVLWSVRGHENIHAKQDGNFNVYEFTNVNAPIIIEASSLNPSYTVQYYATIVRYALNQESDRTLELIDTRKQTLPLVNKATQETVKIALDILKDEKGNKLTTDINNGKDSNLYTVKTYDDVTEIYKEEKFVFEKAHLWKNIDKLWQNDNYVIKSISILKDGRDSESENAEDWWIYKSENNGQNITFTNLASEENIKKDENDEIQQGEDHTILITEGMVIRLYYEYVTESDFDVDNVVFYDYDITSGKEDGGLWDTRQQGINSHYRGTDTSNIYGFGNINCQTGQGAAKWDENFLNAFNTGKFYGCTFGLVTGLDENKDVVWGNGIKAPDIFGETDITGKKVYQGGKLTFNRRGDVYTLTAADSTAGSRTDLEYFFNPSDHDKRIYDGVTPDPNGKPYKAIYTNNFWVVDEPLPTDRKDQNWGKYNDKVYMKGYNDDTDNPNQRGAEIKTQYFPVADDGNNHNYFFGMKYSVSFNVTADYIGPLEYMFFGDDDMWVFLEGELDDKPGTDTKLICDIGGVHSSVGQYVDLRDYIPNGSAGDYTLRFFYTERGASGSTCWMSFTLPSVTSTIEEKGTASISISKALQNQSGESVQSDEEYEFSLNLYTDATKQTLVNTPFSVQINRADGSTDYHATASGKTINIAAGDTAIIRGVPIGMYYVIEETQDDRFDVLANGEEGYVVEGLIETEVNAAVFTNIQKGYILPNTGGIGTMTYMFSGIALMGAALLIYKKQRRPMGRG